MSNIFPTAQEARNLALDVIVIFNEITAIQSAIISAINENKLEVVVSGTTMTNTDELSEEYFEVWQRTKTDKLKDEQMKRIINYFETVGYSIIRIINEETGITFKWFIRY